MRRSIALTSRQILRPVDVMKVVTRAGQESCVQSPNEIAYGMIARRAQLEPFAQCRSTVVHGRERLDLAVVLRNDGFVTLLPRRRQSRNERGIDVGLIGGNGKDAIGANRGARIEQR